MSGTPPVSVVCAIVRRGGLVMLARRPPGKKLAGCWEFPGGKVESGEAAEEALHRELKEELGCTVRVVRALPTRVHPYQWGSIELIPFICELLEDSMEPHPHEHTAIVWVTADELHSFELAPADLPLLKMLA